MKFILGLAMSVLLFSFNAYAGGGGSGNEQGNGGFVLDCEFSSAGYCSSTVFYDTYEAETRYSMKPNFDHNIRWKECFDNGGYYKEEKCLKYSLQVAKALLQRLAAKDQGLYNLIEAHLEAFPKEVKFLPDIVIFPTEDMGIGFIPPNRQLRQLVVQHEPIVDEDPRYIISHDLWIKMNPDQQAAAILHEVIYRQALINQTLKSSQMVRYFNALILSDKISEMTPEKYTQVKSKTFCFNNLQCVRN